MKSNLDVMYKTDSECETEGIWIQFSDTIKFRVKRFGGRNTPSIKKKMAKYNKRYARQIEMGTLPEETERRIYTKSFVEVALLDWEGIEIDGEITPFSTEKAVELLVHLPDLCDRLVAEASDIEHFKEDLGNS